MEWVVLGEKSRTPDSLPTFGCKFCIIRCFHSAMNGYCGPNLVQLIKYIKPLWYTCLEKQRKLVQLTLKMLKNIFESHE